jgi:ribosomal-protein-alanine N-acetyltransferase
MSTSKTSPISVPCRLSVELFDRTEKSIQRLEPLCDEWQYSGGFWPMSEILKTLQTPGRWLYMFFDSKEVSDLKARPLGMIFFGVEGDLLDLYYIYIAEKDRRLGLGQVLINWWTVDAPKIVGFSPRAFVLEVKHTNRHAIALYQKNGFNIIGLRKKYYSSGEDAVLMEYSCGSELN